MPYIKTKVSLLAVAVLGVSLLAFGPVYAQTAPDESTEEHQTSHKTTMRTTATSETKVAVEGEQATTVTAEDKGSVSLRDKHRAEALEKVAEKRKAAQTRTKEQRQKSCEARAEALNKRFSNYGAQADRHLEVFDNILAKVKDFHDTKKLDSADYDALLKGTEARRADAVKSIEALKAVNVAIDCASDDPAASVAAVQAAVKDTRTALHEYRVSIKDVIKSLKASKETTETTTEAN